MFYILDFTFESDYIFLCLVGIVFQYTRHTYIEQTLEVVVVYSSDEGLFVRFDTLIDVFESYRFRLGILEFGVFVYPLFELRDRKSVV